MSSLDAYVKKYDQGYGTMYPEGHIIRFYEKFLKYEKNITGEEGLKVLDFGCGNGTHAMYFASKGFDVYGVDIIPSAINQIKERFPTAGEQFICINSNDNLESIFSHKFDIIIANQSLYYLSDSELERTMRQFDRLLSDKGIVYFTMMGTRSYYFPLSVENNEKSGLREVKLTGRLNESTFINFIDDEEELAHKFQLFIPDFIGHYDCTMREGSGFHYQFIGLKRT